MKEKLIKAFKKALDMVDNPKDIYGDDNISFCGDIDTYDIGIELWISTLGILVFLGECTYWCVVDMESWSGIE